MEVTGLEDNTYYDFQVVAYQSQQTLFSPIVSANTAAIRLCLILFGLCNSC